MNIGKKIEQYGVFIVAILIGGGFAFGGIASYAGITGGGSSPDGGEREPPQLPAENIVAGNNLSIAEQASLGYQNDVVFVNILENANSSAAIDKQQLVSEFNSRVYVSTVDPERSRIAARFGYNEFPRVVVVSGAVQRGRLVPRVKEADPDRASIESAVCETMNNWNSLAAKCSIQ